MKSAKDRGKFVGQGVGYILLAFGWMLVGFYCKSAPVLFWSGMTALASVIVLSIFVLWVYDLLDYLREKRRNKGWAKFGNRRLYSISFFRRMADRYRRN